jgi:hypothetical protein
MARRKPVKKISLREAAEYAHDHGLIGDFYALDQDTITSLRDLYHRTKWRQSQSSIDGGHTIMYAFHQALKRKLPQSKDKTSHLKKVRLATQMANEAATLWSKYDLQGDPSITLIDVADAFSIAAEAAEEADLVYDAKRQRKLANQLYERAGRENPSSRDKLRTRRSGMRRKKSHSRRRRYTRARDPRRPQRQHLTPRQREIVSKKIKIMIKEGYPRRVAYAAAYRYAGVKRPRGMKTKHLSRAEHAQLMKARRRDSKLRTRKSRRLSSKRRRR